MAEPINAGMGPEKPKGQIRGIWAITIIIVIAMLVGGAVWYWYYKGGVQDTGNVSFVIKPSESPSTSASASPSTSGTDETAGWKTYTDKEYGFSVKYPQAATATVSSHEGASGDLQYYVFFVDKTGCGDDAQCSNIIFTTQVLENRQNYTGKQWVDANYSSPGELKTRADVTVDGIKGEKITSDRGVDGYKLVFVQDPQGTLMYQFSWDGNDKNLEHIFDLFLGSFKFKR